MSPFVKSIKKRSAIAPAVVLSLFMHLATGACLVFCLSTDTVSSARFNGIDLVWISLADKHAGDKTRNKTSRPEHKPTIETGAEKKMDIEGSAHKQDVDQESVIAAETLANLTMKNDASSGGAMAISGKNTGQANNAENPNHSELNTVVAYPLYKENSPPAYPEIARVRGYEGIVLVSAQILPNGRVGNVKIRKSSGYSILDQSAIQAVKPWKFEPARKAGNPFTAWVELPIRFILRNNSQS